MADFRQWADQVLHDAGVPITSENENTLYKWARSESGANPFSNGRISNNPLNTKQPFPGAQDSGISVTPGVGGVKSYADLTSSARATAQTLTNGYYPDIISMLQNSVPTKDWSSAARAQVSKWGTSLGFLGGSGSAPSGNFVTQGASLLGGAAAGGSSIPGLSGLIDAISGVGRAIGGAGGAIGGGVQSAEQDALEKLIAVAEVMLGAALMLGGLAVLAVLAFQKAPAPIKSIANAPLKAGGTAAKVAPQTRGVATAASTAKPKAAPKPAVEPTPKEKPRISAGGREIQVTNPESRARLAAAGVEA